MKFSAVIVAIAATIPTLVEANIATALLVCNADLINNPSAAGGAKLFTDLCINFYKCEHSLAPSFTNNAFTGACLNCPNWSPIPTLGGCAIIPQ